MQAKNDLRDHLYSVQYTFPAKKEFVIDKSGSIKFSQIQGIKGGVTIHSPSNGMIISYEIEPHGSVSKLDLKWSGRSLSSPTFCHIVA
ncbi:hypothetical protein DFA_10524 [Cavenderia fasciculata]|uniref:Uncharacterized protein n=1 Tax=Cavenderia fasciculata TaxID=261658 RepID=F4QAG3_CACFS|nr:uncharacterized protein DFA_10524 [Cavenderia fasciculata]EGG15682.1 hypothetical protein DFA_10524 [Cavenderia fasciculata]|eukprot:XP_004354424.1 hypothetical protein DFA_10524 [Cavenderia fasciculata]